MKSASDIARAFLLNGSQVHLCARGTCDCLAELALLIEQAREDGARSERVRTERLRLAKPRIAEALSEVREENRRHKSA